MTVRLEGRITRLEKSINPASQKPEFTIQFVGAGGNKENGNLYRYNGHHLVKFSEQPEHCNQPC